MSRQSDWSVQASSILKPICEACVAGIRFPHYEPPPNAWIRWWQKRLLGIEWRDLRPKRAMQELKGLK